MKFISPMHWLQWGTISDTSVWIALHFPSLIQGKNIFIACCLLLKKLILTLGTPPSLKTWLSQESWNLIFCELQLVIIVEQGIITWASFFKKSGVCHLSCGNISQLVTCFINNNYIFPWACIGHDMVSSQENMHWIWAGYDNLLMFF